MKSITTIILSIGFLIFMIGSQKSAGAAEFPLSSKGWQVTVTKMEGQNTSKALAIGKVTPENAKEYCERDPGGETKEYGGKLTKDQCVEKVLKGEKGKLYSASADCPRKTIKTSWGGTFTVVGMDQFGQYIWRNIRTGEVLDGSNASGAPIVGEQFKMLCPAFSKP
jgi:hypothetical protein